MDPRPQPSTERFHALDPPIDDPFQGGDPLTAPMVIPLRNDVPSPTYRSGRLLPPLPPTPPPPPAPRPQPVAYPHPNALSQPVVPPASNWGGQRRHHTEPVADWADRRATARGTARAPGPVGAPDPISVPGRAGKVSVGDGLTIAGGAFVPLFSALPFASYTDGRFVAVAGRAGLATSWTAWSPTTFLAPVSWLAIFSAVLVAGLGLLRILKRRQPIVLGFGMGQLRFVFGLMSFLILFCLSVSKKTVLFGDDRPQLTQAGIQVDSTLSLALGGYLMLLAALTMLVGAALTLRGQGGPLIWPLPAGLRARLARAAGQYEQPAPIHQEEEATYSPAYGTNYQGPPY